jgi:tetraacyldisaccharide 4'-kinase
VPWRRIAYPQTQADWIASAALLPFSWLYGLGWRSYEAVYRFGFKRRREFDLPIVGVGNLTAGGSGKTPVVIELVRLALERGLSPAVSLSGYGSPSASGTIVLNKGDCVVAAIHGDEPAEFRRAHPNVPLILGRDRVAAAQAAHDFECLILDDGFQHLRLARNADIVIWDDDLPNKRLLPAGPMREPMSGLDRASAVATPNRAPSSYAGTVLTFTREYQEVRDVATDERFPLDWLRGRQIDALCAIARPEPFFEVLEQCGAIVRRRTALGDHDALGSVRATDFPTVVTEKDAVKLSAEPGQFFALGLRIRFTNEEATGDWLMKNLSR